MVAVLTVHRVSQTWTETVDLYIPCHSPGRSSSRELPAEKMWSSPTVTLTLVLEKGVEVRPLRGSAFPRKGDRSTATAWEKLRGKVALKIVGMAQRQ